ncbi:hypothetical protein BH23GEM6_BH23GEM6_03130 [soil metagenome]
MANARTLTLIGHGLGDDRVHPEQSLDLYNALRLQRVPLSSCSIHVSRTACEIVHTSSITCIVTTAGWIAI